MSDRTLRAALLADRARTGAYASAAVAASQLLMRAQTPSGGESEAEQLGAAMANGIVEALTAPLLYASLACLVLFTVLAITYHIRLNSLRQDPPLSVPAPQPVLHRGPHTPPGQAPVTWGRPTR